jgi:hypothetical protein
VLSRWLGRTYLVRVPMHYLPGILFRSKDHRDPQIVWGDILPSAKLALEPLYLHNVGKLRSYTLRYDLEASGLAIPTRRCGALHCLGNLLPSVRDDATGVGEGYVVSMGEQLLRRLGVSFHELTYGQVVLLNYFVKMLYRTHY